MRVSAAWCLVAISLTLAGCVMPVDEIGASREPIIGGELDSRYDAVGAMEEGLCTVVLIAPDAILTAAHCAGFFLPGTQIRFGPDLYESLYRGYATDFIVHPEYDRSDSDNPQHDIAVIRIYSPITEIEPLPIDFRRLTRADIGTRTRWIGYGGQGAEGTPGRRASVELEVDGVGGDWFYTVEEGERRGACPGDSGGAVVVEEPDGPVLVGIIQAATTRCGEGSVATRLDTNRDFIERYGEPATCSASPGRGVSAHGMGWLFLLSLIAAFRGSSARDGGRRRRLRNTRRGRIPRG